MSTAIRVLVGDGDERSRKAAAGALRSAGYAVEEAADGADCLSRARAAPPGLVVLGRDLPGPGAQETCRRLKADPALADTAVLVLSGSPDGGAAGAGDGSPGADLCLSGPCEPRELPGLAAVLLRLRRAERALRHGQPLATVATLARGVRHEISSPVMGVMNYAELIRERIAATDPEAAGFAEAAAREARRVADLVQGLMGALDRRPSPVHTAGLEEVLSGVLVLTRAAARVEDTVFEVDLPDGLPPVRCRRDLVQRVLLALLANAREAVCERYPAGDPGKLIRLSASVFEEGGARWVRMTVEDRGPGLAAAARERMFEPFFTTRDPATHTGLGLSTARGAAEALGGRLGAEAAAGGGGTRFHFDLPAAPAPGTAATT